ncbi:MAG: excinuclease ABC subunit UvrC, partial [Bacteroidales bacterium]|nr:excinuclease ABC subunit UvrC [Bacteroidales bacterium]
QYFSAEGELIYVGKAKNLKRRVNSYFNKEQTGKVLALVRRVAKLEYIVVNTEFDALLLENNLIKEHQPHYNIMLKDDKTYPWLCLTNEPYPRLFPTRRYLPGQDTYFGPYASVRMMHTMLDLIHDMFPLRTCRHRLSDSVVAAGKVKLCLQYQMKRCAGPCQGLQSHAAYDEQIDQIKNLLRGHIKPLLSSLKEKMLDAAQRQDFKTAQRYKEKWQLLEQYQSRSAVVSDKLSDADVLQVKEKDDYLYFNYMRIVDGLMVQAHTIEIRKKLDETPQDLWQGVLVDFRRRYASTATEVFLPFEPEWEMPDLKITVPKGGDGKKLLELSARNIDYFILEKSRRLDLVDPDRHRKRLLAEMQKTLGMSKPPAHIECFDNSNMLGEYPVSAMTVSKDGKLSKRDYRHFLVRTVEGPDDYASMEEVIERRYSRLLRENQPLPQLLIVDGGKGQLSSAYKVLCRLGLERRIFLIGIAENLEELYKVGDPYPLLLDKKSEVLKHIQLLRDEAHRFGITHYRKRHVKGVVKTELTEIKGIGTETAQTLLRRFKSVKQIRSTPLADLTEAVGAAKAKLVFDYFQNTDDDAARTDA